MTAFLSDGTGNRVSAGSELICYLRPASHAALCEPVPSLKKEAMTTNPDFHYVQPEHRLIDARLTNWDRWVQVRPQAWCSPIWKLGRSGGRQWHEPEFRPACDTLDGMAMEKAIQKLPDLHKSALRWFYVYRYSEQKFRREAGLTRDGLVQVLKDARQMLINRRV